MTNNTPHRPPQPARTEAERKLLAADGLPPEWDEWFYDDWFADIWREYTDEYWCANCCEYIYYDITATQHNGSG